MPRTQLRQSPWRQTIPRTLSTMTEKPVNCLGPAGGYILHFPDGNETRLRYILTAQGLRTEFRISSRWRMADPTDHIRAAARKVTKHFINMPNVVLPFEDEARKIMLGTQVVQSIKSQQHHSRWQCGGAACQCRRAARCLRKGYGRLAPCCGRRRH